MDRVIFFDLDDTLYRRSTPFKEACRLFFRGGMKEETMERAFAATQKRCEEVYFPVRRGEMTAEEGFRYRFQQGFRDAGVELSGEEALKFRDAYQKAQREIKPEEKVQELLRECRRKYRKIGIITNGDGARQRAKIETMGLLDLVDPDLVIISGEAGTDKPDPGIFAYAAGKAGAEPEDLVYVGDSPETDVMAAKQAGWKAFLWDWENPPVKEILN